ncbi:S-layer homology domain-containing protein [Acutalibacter intestini]|uniref:S-layer homology domain-containing protein n=1 Tax=Acutalibacter intestini TaxID=3093659 RepID=UPI002AC99B15|nr:S-layer homology domain-containing protein [Acutalibacter sp. M00204]
MRKAILTVLMMLVLVIPAYAAEGEAATDQPIQQEQESVVVSTLEELQAAIDAAEDGDTIAISSKIEIRENCSVGVEDKVITVVPDSSLTDNALFYVVPYDIENVVFENIVMDGNEIDNLSAIDFGIYKPSVGNGTITISNVTFQHFNCNYSVLTLHWLNAIIQDCVFTYNTTGRSCMEISINASATVTNTTFIDNYASLNGSGIGIRCNGNAIIDGCTIKDNKTLENSFGRSGGGIYIDSGKTVEIRNTIITGNSADVGGGVLNDGKLKMIDTIIYGNQASGCADDIRSFQNSSLSVQYSVGMKVTYSIIDLDDEPVGFYSDYDYNRFDRETHIEFLGETLELENILPNNSLFGAKFIFASELPEPPTEQPQEPGTTGGEQPPQGSGDDPTDTPSQPPEPPTEPPQDDTPDNPTDTTPNTPQPPQKPSDGGNSGDDGYTPPIDYRPSQRPTKPTEDDKPQEQPDIPATAKPQLACNGAVIDTSRTVVLLGYGDGLLHEDDLLTRAQLATIIFRLLDDESIAKYNNAELAFADVVADAWYAPYVNVIQAAGIVNGVGNGRYDPNGKVTWSQILAILSRFVEQKEYSLQHIQYSGWAEQAIQTTVANGWIEDSADFKPDAVISRGELVRIINDVLALYR